MAFDAFLKLDGIDGESNDKTHKGEIEISSYSWGVTNTGSLSHGGGGGEGKATSQDFHFAMPISKASPLLLKACATGQHIRDGTLTCRKSGGSQLEFLKIKLSDVLVSSYQTGGTNKGADHVDDVPQDQLSLNFAKIDFIYTPQGADGKPGTPVEVVFDFNANIEG
jgi:type VI secretion system secreted protein Hcp